MPGYDMRISERIDKKPIDENGCFHFTESAINNIPCIDIFTKDSINILITDACKEVLKRAMDRNNKFRVSIYSLIHPISETDRLKAQRIHKLNSRLGIIMSYDNSVDIIKYIPSMYKSLDEYEYDKNTAQSLIYLGKPIPKDLERKLIAARIELENKGILEVFKDN